MIRAPVQNDVRLIYKKIEEGADVNFVFGRAYGCPEGYTPLMSACHRGRLDAAKALLRSGADPNFMNGGGDLTVLGDRRRRRARQTARRVRRRPGRQDTQGLDCARTRAPWESTADHGEGHIP